MDAQEKDPFINCTEETITPKNFGNGFNLTKHYKIYKYNNRQKYNKNTSGRLILKTGHLNFEKWMKNKYRVFPDIIKVFIDNQWKWTILYCIITYNVIWLAFAALWWIILHMHGDFEAEHLPHAAYSTDWEPCVREIYGFTSLYLFSIEIHTTIGYGSRIITLECPSAMLTMCLETIIGTISQCFIIGIVFAKLTRSKNRAQTLLFSKNIVIHQRDRNLSMIFRIGNTRKARIIGISAHAYLIRHNISDVLDDLIKLDLNIDTSENVSFIFPISAVHTINENSPFYTMSAYDILKENIEILVIFEGTIESTGQSVQTKTSYTAQEILWGHRFITMIDYCEGKQGFIIDYSKLNATKSVKTPLCSADQLYFLRQSQSNC